MAHTRRESKVVSHLVLLQLISQCPLNGGAFTYTASDMMDCRMRSRREAGVEGGIGNKEESEDGGL